MNCATPSRPVRWSGISFQAPAAGFTYSRRSTCAEVYGLRLEDGTSASDYAGKGNRKIFWLALIVGIAGMLLSPLVTGTVWLIPILPLVLGAFGLFLASRTEAESRSLFASEA